MQNSTQCPHTTTSRTMRWRCTREAGHQPADLHYMLRVQEPMADGTWSPAEPLPYMGWKARLEQRLRRRGMKRLANLLAAWDEKGLGR